MRRPGTYKEKSFIRVEWSAYRLTDIVERISKSGDRIRRICLSMITNGRANHDTSEITRTLKRNTNLPVSLLISPTVVSKDHLRRFQEDGADRIGIALDCATPRLFREMRGRPVKSPHEWERYWECFEEALDLFGRKRVGVHLMVGLGESEREMTETIQKVHNLGGTTHLFSFFPENDSYLCRHPQPPIGQYRRVQLARFLIDEDARSIEDFRFDESGRLTGFGLSDEILSPIVESGRPFTTSGCPNENGEVACNRPYANCLPGDEIRNFPFSPGERDVQKILDELGH
jgi:biotin synthase